MVWELKLKSGFLNIDYYCNSFLVFPFLVVASASRLTILGRPRRAVLRATTTTMTDLKEEIRKAIAFSKTPEGIELSRQNFLNVPKKKPKYRHSDETKVKMSLNSGRRRAVWVGEVRYASISEAAEAEGISYANFQMRLSRGREGYRYA